MSHSRIIQLETRPFFDEEYCDEEEEYCYDSDISTIYPERYINFDTGAIDPPIADYVKEDEDHDETVRVKYFRMKNPFSRVRSVFSFLEPKCLGQSSI